LELDGPDRRVHPFAVRPSELLRTKRTGEPRKRRVQRATHPPDLSLGRAASIRTCLAARKQDRSVTILDDAALRLWRGIRTRAEKVLREF